ncbi:MAG: tetratricopeptide repeat protein [Proteobacteria bacterium]|nr:tetratricopeptide repeat protein [Pseudomonadota bacterium]
MSEERWDRLQQLFHAALEQPGSERAAYLESACADDPSLIPEVNRLLGADAGDFVLLDRGVAPVADALLEPAGSAPAGQIGPYRLVRLLGEGGMGVVYLAERPDLARQVAIKLLRDAGLSPARRTLFTAEQRTLAQLVHPSITRLYDADVTPAGLPYIVMEYVEGLPLTQYCEARRCDLGERLRLFRRVCEAVLYAHQHAIIHRDLKPSNVLVRADGSVSLLDFGIAKHLAGPGEGGSQTRTTLRMMTPLYAAPEQLAGGVLGVQTDVYALGVILYQLLAGSPPYDLEGRTDAQAARLVMERTPRRPSTQGRALLGPAAWDDLDILCLTAMHRDPAQRYASVEALIRDLGHYERGEPLAARPDGLGYRARKFFGRHRLAVSLGTLGLTAVIVAALTFTLRLQAEHAATAQEARRAQRIEQFVTSLLQGGDADAGPADTLRVITLLDRGTQEADGLTAEPAVQADLYATLGTLYQKLGRFERADELLSAALRLRRTQLPAADPQVIESVDALAALRLAQGRLEEAHTLAARALTLARGAPAAHASLGRVLVTAGRVEAEQGHYEEAVRTLEEAVKLDSPAGSPPDLAASLRALGSAQYSAGRYDEARKLYERLLQLDRQQHGLKHPSVADDLGSLASIQQDLGYYPAAESLARESLEIISGYYGPDHPRTANAMTMVGRALLYQKKYPQAQAALERALDIEQRAFGPASAAVADTLNELGNAASLREDYDSALKYFRQEAEIYRSIYGDHHYLLAIALSNVAYVLLLRKDYADAELAFRDVVERFTETLGAQNVNTGIAHVKLGRTLLRERRFDEARTQTQSGYDNLSAQANPGISYLQAARKDLAAEYDALGQAPLAQRFRAELAAHESH